MSRYVRGALTWFVFIAVAFALPASAVRVHEGRLSRCHSGCLMPALSKWPSRQIKKNGLPPQSLVAKNQDANAKSRALAGTDTDLSR
jgi:hypothetical protein